jgi:hypothetical protein
MASAAAIILAATELLDVNLLALHQPEHLGLHDGTVNQRRSKLKLAVLTDSQHLVEDEFTAPFHWTEIDLKFLPPTMVSAVLASVELGVAAIGKSFVMQKRC